MQRLEDGRDRVALLAALDHLTEALTRRQQEEALAALLVWLRGRLASAFRAQGWAVVRWLRGRPRPISSADVAAAWDAVVRATEDDLAGPLETAVIAALGAGWDGGSAAIGLDRPFDRDSPDVIAHLASAGAARLSGITATTGERLDALMTATADGRWSDAALVAAIAALFRRFAGDDGADDGRDRATLIAETELDDGYAAGMLSAGRALAAGDVDAEAQLVEKRWMTMQDNRVSPDCRMNAAQGWLPIEEPFATGKMRPLNHPGCRCYLLLRRADGAGREGGE